ncbi:hypothetical protein ACHAXS_014263 [Conticribra weissflogii]
MWCNYFLQNTVFVECVQTKNRPQNKTMSTKWFECFCKKVPLRIPMRRNFSTNPPKSTTPQTNHNTTTDRKGSPKPNPSIWDTLRAPALFGIGLYLGLMTFGDHHDTKVESQSLSQMRALVYKNSDMNDGNTNNKR